MGTNFKPSEINRFDITEVYSHPDATVDIVFVHGLDGDPQGSWTAKNGTFWPTELLLVTLNQTPVRILVYGYNADVYAFGTTERSASSDIIDQHAQELVTALAKERKRDDNDQNAIIWVTHSLGGILLKCALELSSRLTGKNVDINRSIFVSTFGIVFLGTPHTGAEPAKWKLMLHLMVESTLPKKLLSSDPRLLRALPANRETLQNINARFSNMYHMFQIDMAYERLKTDVDGTKSFIVDQMAASPELSGVGQYGIEATHSDMCKFSSQISPGYHNVSVTIKGWVLECQPVIRSRWVTERKARQQQKDNDARESPGGYLEPGDGNRAEDSMPNTPALSHSGIISPNMVDSVASLEPVISRGPIFIKPPGFRPNSLFVGRVSELAEMHRMLFDKRRRTEGVAAVLVQSLPGGGKTHLARQYVYSHLDDFPGGVFWVRAQSLPQLAAGFWDIARSVAIKPSKGSADDSEDLQHFISIVHQWFSTHHDWLLVLDGIKFDHVEDLTRFIPDSTNSSLIYTSTERDVGGDHHFMNPQVIKLPLLSAREAQELFLLELDKKQPTTEERKHSLDLVSRMGFLPLVIHATAKRLKATGEPLAKFARSYATGPKLRELDTYVDVVKQLEAAQAFEALNLIKILSLFSQHIPVEMISLGLGALDVRTKAYESATGRSLNNTFKILNRFALINRNDFEDAATSSQNSRGSREMLADNIDIVQLHSVVQDFFTDLIKGEGKFPQWLGQAVALFNKSYKKANQRIKKKTNAGLVADYRSYEVHGTRLLFHLSWYEKKNVVIPEVRSMLEECLRHIVEEIKRRTRESSNDLVQGRPAAFQTSIFDRTSSSSDTGPPTPGADGVTARASTWGTDRKSLLESPISSKYDDFRQPGSPPRADFTTISERDAGYDTDRDEGPYERPSRFDRHRTTRALEHNRYKDNAGAWRALIPNVSDPRVSPVAQGFFEIPDANIRQSSRGRISARSPAEAALSQITRESPPPIRGGGYIQDRRDSRSTSRRPTLLDDGGRPISGYSSYAPAVTSESFLWATTGSQERPSNSKPSPKPKPASPAITSLQNISQRAETSQPSRYLPFPDPEPFSYMAPYPMSDLDLGRHSGDRSFEWIPDPKPYQTQTGPLPFHSDQGSLLEPLRTQQHNRNNLNLELLPNFRNLDGTLAENFDSRHRYRTDGYTSQPMSRDPSGQLPPGPRSPSLIESEPPPELPGFSPKINPTSYQVYENRRDREIDGRLRQSPNLAYAKAALIGRFEEWTRPSENVSAKRNTLNAAAPAFVPSSTRLLHPTNRTSPPLAASSSAPSPSGGFRVGRRIIEFGDFPEPVDCDLARERRERQSADARAAFEEGHFRRLKEKEKAPPAKSASDLTDRIASDGRH